MFKKPELEEWKKIMDARMVIESAHKWREWGGVIPYLKFKEDWEVQVIPPFGGALTRFLVRKDGVWVSIYLDGYDELGYVGEPYWEIFPNIYHDTSRFLLDETDELLSAIEESLGRKEEEDEEV